MKQVSEIIRAHPLFCWGVSNIALVFEDKMGSNTRATCEKMRENGRNMSDVNGIERIWLASLWQTVDSLKEKLHELGNQCRNVALI